MAPQTVTDIFMNYSNWLTGKATVSSSGNTFHIVTPFTHFDGDMIEVFADISEDSILFSDDGITIDRLHQYGLDVYSSSRKQQIKQALSGYDVMLRHGELQKVVQASGGDISLALHKFISSISAISYMIYTAKTHTTSIFDNEVVFFLRDNDISYTRRSFSGATGTYGFDIVVHEKHIVVPFDCRKTTNSIYKAQRLGFQFTDMRRANVDFSAIAVLPDTSANDQQVRDILSGYADAVISWGDRDDLPRRLSA